MSPSPTLPTRAELRALLALAVPAVFIQLGMMLMGVVDTVMVGHLSAEALAAVALGNLYFFGVAIFGMGVLMALDPIVAQAVGARDEPAVARGVQRGLLIACVLALVAMVLMLPVAPVLTWMRQPASIVPLASTYVHLSISGVLPFLAFVVFRQTLQATGRMRPIVFTIVLANLLNAGLNWVLIFGNLGAPAMGVAGSAWATAISRWAMALMLAALGWPVLRPYLTPFRPEVLHLTPLGRMIRLALPIGGQLQLEYTAFGLTGVLIGTLGVDPLAGHQVALNLASLTYMVPLGISAATAVLVGQEVGRDHPHGARRYARAGLVVGAAFMLMSGTLFLAAPRWLASLYTSSDAVLLMAATLLPLAGVFQVFDGIQVVAGGVLRGLGDTRWPMLINLIGFWAVGIPTGILLGFRAGMGAQGLWWGLVFGLAAVAVILLIRVRRRMQARLGRVLIDDHAPSP
ncbi:MAG TPA: MATE family efflux transporter [Gemmatimonadales bacterium]|nr:MATE family efflux transporter [Gemmatimonadales bacterium]